MSEWIAAQEDPERKAARTSWQDDVDRWTATQTAVRERITAPFKARYDDAYAAYTEVLNTLSAHPVSSLDHVAEKIEILAAEFDGFELPLEYLADVLADVRRLGGAA